MGELPAEIWASILEYNLSTGCYFTIAQEATSENEDKKRVVRYVNKHVSGEDARSSTATQLNWRLISKVVTYECSRIFYGNNHFIFPTPSELSLFVNAVGLSNTRYIPTVEIVKFSEHYHSSLLSDLATKFLNLQDLFLREDPSLDDSDIDESQRDQENSRRSLNRRCLLNFIRDFLNEPGSLQHQRIFYATSPVAFGLCKDDEVIESVADSVLEFDLDTADLRDVFSKADCQGLWYRVLLVDAKKAVDAA